MACSEHGHRAPEPDDVRHPAHRPSRSGLCAANKRRHTSGIPAISSASGDRGSGAADGGVGVLTSPANPTATRGSPCGPGPVDERAAPGAERRIVSDPPVLVPVDEMLGTEKERLRFQEEITELIAGYQRTLEIMGVLRDLLDGKPVDFHGDFVDLTLDPPRVRPPSGCPPFYFGGLSEPAREVAARAADVFLMWPDTLSGVQAVISDMRERAARHGRERHHRP